MALVPLPAKRMAIVLSGLAFAVVMCWGVDGPVTGAIANSLEPEATDVGERERLYLAISSGAMTTMMRDMQTSGGVDADHDFVVQMVAHHQGAIDMAMALLRTGSNERLIRLAHEIIVTQREEIAAMRLAVAEQAKAGQ
jgi:uncharacterized protein (DUF305 family)